MTKEEMVEYVDLDSPHSPGNPQNNNCPGFNILKK